MDMNFKSNFCKREKMTQNTHQGYGLDSSEVSAGDLSIIGTIVF